MPRRSADRVLHHMHHADPTIDRTKKSVVTYKKARQPISVWNIVTLETDLSRQADGTVPPEPFEANCDRALRVMLEYQRRLDESDLDDEEIA